MSVNKTPDWAAIKEEYIINRGIVVFKELAAKHGVNLGTLRSRKSREDWDSEIVNDPVYATTIPLQHKSVAPVAIIKRNVAIKNDMKKLDDANLTEKQRLFCLYYVKSFNATMSAIKAGYAKDSAHVQGHDNLRHPNIITEIKRLKGDMQQELFIDAMDVLNKYVAIAFADISDFANWGQRDGENYMDFKSSSKIDGSMISEVSSTKDGIKVKLVDKMKALEKLELYFDLFPDHFRRKVEEEKLTLQSERLELDRQKNESVSDKEGEIADMLRGLVDDLNGETEGSI